MPHGNRFGINIGAWLRASGGEEPKTSNKCPLVAVPENLPLDGAPDPWLIVQALDLAEDVADEQRIELIDAIGRAVAGFVNAHADGAALRLAYSHGDFRSAFIHKTLRSYLEGGPPQPIVWPTVRPRG